MEDKKLDSLQLSLVLYFASIAVWETITFKLGAWKKWRVYYPTILFFCIGNLIGFAVFHHYLLWEFKSHSLSHLEIDFLQMVFIFSCTTILFLHYYPQKLIAQILYILSWVSGYSAIEWIFHMLGGIVYNHGWSIWWSVAHNVYQFILLRVHHVKPILAWIFAIIALGITMFIFKVQI
jgi:hypothetical protein